MPLTVVLDLGPDERLVLKSPYAPTLVQTLKDAIPYTYREWDSSAKVWRIAPEWGDVVTQVLADVGAHVVDRRPLVAPPVAVAPVLQAACTYLFIVPEAPVEVAEAAFKALAKKHHPDVGGDTAMMQALNDAIATFKAFNEVPL